MASARLGRTAVRPHFPLRPSAKPDAKAQTRPAAFGPRARLAAADRFAHTDFPVADPQSLGLSAARLQKLGEHAKKIGSDSVLVIRDGKVVYEWYASKVRPQTALDTWSVAKTHTAALIGAAIQQGHIRSVDQRASDFIKEWAGPNDPRRDITLKDLLSGVSGLDTDAYPEETRPLKYMLNLASDYGWAVPPGAWLKPDQSKHAISAKATHAPGTKWKYNNRAIQVLEEVLQRSTGMPADQFAKKALWEPLGMSASTDWAKDAKGNPTAYSSVKATTRDLARFGTLLLHGGAWKGQQLIDAGFARAMTQPSSTVNPAYGYLTWLNTDAPAWRGIDNRRFEGKPFTMMSDRYFSAQGVGNNFIGVDPADGTIIVHARRAPNERLLKSPPWKVAQELFGDAEQKDHRRFLELLKAAEVPRPR